MTDKAPQQQSQESGKPAHRSQKDHKKRGVANEARVKAKPMSRSLKDILVSSTPPRMPHWPLVERYSSKSAFWPFRSKENGCSIIDYAVVVRMLKAWDVCKHERPLIQEHFTHRGHTAPGQIWEQVVEIAPKVVVVESQPRVLLRRSITTAPFYDRIMEDGLTMPRVNYNNIVQFIPSAINNVGCCHVSD